MASFRNRGGTWKADVSANGVRRSKTFPTREEAEVWAQHTENALKSNSPIATLTQASSGLWVGMVDGCGQSERQTFGSKEVAEEWVSQKAAQFERQEKVYRSGQITNWNRVQLPPHLERMMPEDAIVGSAAPYCPISGVYFLIKGGAIVYVGESCDIHNRVAEHRRRGGKSFTHYFVIECHEAYRKTLETNYIRELRPIYNQDLRQLRAVP